MEAQPAGWVALATVLFTAGCGNSVIVPGDPDPGAPGGDPYPGMEPSPACEYPAPVPPGEVQPVLHYPLDGDTLNLGSLGPLYDGTAAGAHFVPGVLHDAAELGSGAFVALPSSAGVLAALDAVTIVFWFQEPAAAATGTAFFDCRSNSDGFHFYRGAYTDSMVTCWGAGDPAVGAGGCDTMAVVAGDWHQVLFERADEWSPLSVWLDGAHVSTLQNEGEDVLGPYTQDVLLHAAHIGDFTNSATIHIDDFRVYDRALSADERCDELGGAWCPCE